MVELIQLLLTSLVTRGDDWRARSSKRGSEISPTSTPLAAAAASATQREKNRREAKAMRRRIGIGSPTHDGEQANQGSVHSSW
jgi:hypothetical protein